MLSFFSGCISLFSNTFNAAMEVGFFRFLGGYIILAVCFGLFHMLHRGAKKM